MRLPPRSTRTDTLFPYTTLFRSGVEHLLLAGVERVRMRRHFHLDQRVFVAVFPLDLVLAGQGGAGQKGKVAGHVLEHHFLVLRMDIGLHSGLSGTTVDRKSTRLNSSH